MQKIKKKKIYIIMDHKFDGTVVEISSQALKYEWCFDVR